MDTARCISLNLLKKLPYSPLYILGMSQKVKYLCFVGLFLSYLSTIIKIKSWWLVSCTNPMVHDMKMRKMHFCLYCWYSAMTYRWPHSSHRPRLQVPSHHLQWNVQRRSGSANNLILVYIILLLFLSSFMVYHYFVFINIYIVILHISILHRHGVCI